MSINVEFKFHSNRNANWVAKFVMEIVALLTLKTMETHPNLWSLWDHLVQKHEKTCVHHYHIQLAQNV
jgi:hypothetical protein